jgi:hypothetical protein
VSIIMAADDPRHGQRRGYYAHRREGSPACASCKRAAAAAEARYQMHRAQGISGRLNPIGTQRRLQALVAMGYTWRAIDGHLGHQNLAEKWGNHRLRYVFPSTAAKVAAVYDKLSMTLPPNQTSREKAAVTKARNLARRKGWPPPLAWDNIDNPDEQPHGWQYVSGDRHADLDDLLDRGVGVSEAARVLGCTVKALEKWMDRHGRRGDYNRLTMRERGAA